MTDLKIKLDIFEGPLDLLLHLIKTLEVDIYDIPIAEITGQYMQLIHSMQELQLEVAGEYIVMAATLMSIKSKMLLPKPELTFDETLELPDGEDPREALVAQLLEYRKYKYAADTLREKETTRSAYYTKEPSSLEAFKESVPPLLPDQVNLIDLFFAFHDVLERRKKNRPVESTISTQGHSIESQIRYITKRLEDAGKGKGVTFVSLFETFNRSEIVTTFMAMLELMKDQTIIAKQVADYAPIYLFNYQTEVELKE